MLRGFDVYKTYLALKRHFNSDRYNYFNYSFKNRGVSARYTTYQNRNDRWFFENLAKDYKKHDEIEGFLVANFIYNPSMWVGEMYGDDSKRIHNEWKRKTESLTYQFTQDVKELRSLIETFNNKEMGLKLGFDRIFTVEDGQHPVLLEQILGKHINIETAIIMDKILQFTDFWNKRILDRVIWPDIYRLMAKYDPFLRIDDLSKYRKIMKGGLDIGT
jgi:hypothetical protein